MYRFPDPKDPDAVLDYDIHWNDNDAGTNEAGDDGWLQGDTIATSTWIVPAGLTKDSDSKTTTTATVWLSGGVEGESYVITNRITTAGGRTDDRSAKLVVSSR